MYLLDSTDGSSLSKIEETTLSALGKKESDLEELLRKNVDIISDEEESMLIVGQQVRNASNGRSDLTAVNQEGDLVLIEIKRDKADIVNRKEAFEFQAIRYAASCATIKTPDELIQNVYAPYVEKHRDEFDEPKNLTSVEVATRRLSDFLKTTDAENFNKKQRIVLVASEFDEQTLSAVAWLNSNDVDISCYRFCPYTVNNLIFIDMKKMLPVISYDDYYVDIAKKPAAFKITKTGITRRSLPKIDAMLEWGVVKPGQTLYAKGKPECEVKLRSDGKVDTDNGAVSIQQWLKSVFGWNSVETYAFTVEKESGRTLSDIRWEYMQKQSEAEVNDD